jgi:hypothetical protein
MIDRKNVFEHFRVRVFVILGLLLFLSPYSQAQERLCDTAYEDCRQVLWNLIDAETAGIDVAFWFMQDTSFCNKIIARHNAGVPVRVLMDPRANPSYNGNEAILNQLAAAGIPMRYKNGGGILHWKMMLFVGQNKLEFSGANYSPSFFVPTTPYQNYIDEAIYFTDDQAIINSFKTKYEDHWTDNERYANYANISAPLTRRYAIYPIDPALNFPFSASGAEDFFNRTQFQLNHETTKIDVVMYRITSQYYTDAIIGAINRGVPVRLIHEQDEYRNRSRPWDAWNIDRLYMAGVQIKWRNAQRLGLNHEKTVLLYGQGMTIFGSSNWTGPSSNYQDEHNYFSTKPWFFQWFVNHFERKWNSASEFVNFTPLAPDVPVSLLPANNATGQAVTTTLRWEGGPWSHKFDIYFGTNANPPLIASNVFLGSVDDGVAEVYSQLPLLQDGTKYYWRIVGKTMANQTASSPVWSFTTAGSTPPSNTPPTIGSVTPNSGTTAGGTNVTISGANFATGATVSFGGTPATAVNVLSNTSITATTPAGQAGAVNVTVTNSNNLSGTMSAGFTYEVPPPPPSAADIVLYASEAPVKAGAYVAVSDASAAGGAKLFHPDAGGAKLAEPMVNPTHYFEMTFTAQANTDYRLWIRGRAQNDFWGNDAVFIQFSDTVTSTGTPVNRIGTTSGDVMNLEECSGCGLSSWGWQDNGWGIGVLGPLINFETTGIHTIRIQTREDGLAIDQIVLSPSTYLNTAPGASKNDTTMLQKNSGGTPPPPAAAPTVTSITPNAGTTAGGTVVTITGTGFVIGATVRFGDIQATNVNVSDGTSLTAMTPAHTAGIVSLVITNPDNQSGTLANAYSYNTPPPAAPTISSVNPNSGTTGGGTTVTIAGTNFSTGATVSFGGTQATNVNVTNTTTITATTPSHAAGTVNIAITNPDNQSATLTNSFTYTSSTPPGETILLADDFNDNSLSDTKWINNDVFSGFTDASVLVGEKNQHLEIGALKQNTSGSHYNGIRSSAMYNFTGAYASVEIVQTAPAATAADAMLTIGKDANNYYRIYVEAGNLICQKRVNSTKMDLLNIPFDAVNHRFLRIRHDNATGNVIFETATGSGGVPGTWVQRTSQLWNTAAVPLSTVGFELKAGTWQAEAMAPGTIIFDTFKSAKP